NYSVLSARAARWRRHSFFATFTTAMVCQQLPVTGCALVRPVHDPSADLTDECWKRRPGHALAPNRFPPTVPAGLPTRDVAADSSPEAPTSRPWTNRCLKGDLAWQRFSLQAPATTPFPLALPQATRSPRRVALV